MKKKSKVLLSVLLALIAIVIILFAGYKYWKDTEYIPPDLEELPTVSGNDMSEIEITDTDKPDLNEQQDRTPKFEYNVSEKKKKYITINPDNTNGEIDSDSDEDLGSAEVFDILYNDFDAQVNQQVEGLLGFVVQTSTNITPLDGPWYSTQCVGIDGSEIDVSEYNASIDSMEDIREAILSGYGFQYYLDMHPKGLDGSEYTLNEPLENPADIFEYPILEDMPTTLLDHYQILIDSKITVNYGTGSYIVLYDRFDNKYLGFATIDCGNDAILEVDVRTSNMDYIEPYIKEMCEACVTILQ